MRLRVPFACFAGSSAALSVISALLALLAVRDADAATPKDEAHAAYERGLEAHARGDEALASDEFAHADDWLPSDAALEAAIESAARAGDAVRVVRLVLRGEGRSLDTAARTTVQDARRTYLPRVALLEVQCGDLSKCTLAVDESGAVDAHAPVPVLPGKYRLHVRRGDASEEATVDVSAGQVVTFAHAWTAAAAPAPAATTSIAPPSTEPTNEATKPTKETRASWVQPLAWIGIGATAVLAGVAIGSGVEAANKHADFTSRNCGAGAGAVDPSCAGLSQDGQSAQTRTDVLVAAAAVVGAATLTFVLFEHPFARMDAAVGPRDARLTLRFP